MLIVAEADVVHLLPVAEAVDLVRAAYIAYSEGRVACPQRLPLPLQPPGAVLLSMPAYDGQDFAGVKLVAVQPENATRGIPIVRATYMLFDAVIAEPLALLGATRLTAIRTGGGGGVGIDLLALPGADTLALIGTGAQAETQLLAAVAVRPIRDVWVHSRDPRRVADFIAQMAPRVRVRLHAAASTGAAVSRAAIVVTATNAAEPVFDDADLQPGTHINAIGAFTAAMQEIPDGTVTRAAVYVDSLDAAWHEAGELAGPLARGLIGREHVRGEIGALASGRIPGRQSETEVTLFKSVGLAAQDLFCAAAVYRRAQAAGVGQHTGL